MHNHEITIDKKPGAILFVDDEPLSLKYFQATIGKYADVRTASSPDAAMEILEAQGDEISIVISDERMPRDSGVSFLSNVRKSWPSTIRILTSAYANIDNLQHAINDAAIYRFVPKPWNLEELCATMREALEVERATPAPVAEPAPLRKSLEDAEEANLALLAILAGGLSSPLKSLNTSAEELAHLSEPSSAELPRNATSYMATWSARQRSSRIATAAAQVRKDVEHCLALADSITKTARSLGKPAAEPASSMAETIRQVIERQTVDGRDHLALDVSSDFVYRMPREIMKFVLSNLMRGVSHQKCGHVSPVEIELFAGAAHNEVRLTFSDDEPKAWLEDTQATRTVRSALWAFGGELLTSADQNQGRLTIVICLPKAN